MKPKTSLKKQKWRDQSIAYILLTLHANMFRVLEVASDKDLLRLRKKFEQVEKSRKRTTSRLKPA